MSYTWDFGDGSPVSNERTPSHVFQAGDYYVKLIAVNSALPCHNSDTAILHIVALQPSKPFVALGDTLLCDRDPILITAVTGNTTAGTTYQWSPAAAILSGNGSPVVTIDPAVSTDIALIAFNGTGMCDSTSAAAMHITVSDVVNARVVPGDTSLCPGDTILLRAFGGMTYNWAPDYNISVVQGDTARVWPLQNITYTISVSDTNNCQATVDARINVWKNLDVDAGEDIAIRYGERTRLNGRAPDGFFWRYNVYPDNTLRPEVKPDKTTTYYLTGRTSKGCIATDSVTVYVTFANLPNAFSPNGDGLNDIFRLFPNNEHFTLLHFSIYDRWGNRVFYTADVNAGWNGMYNDKPAELGVYYYYISYEIGGENYTFKGDVTLVR